MLAVAAAIHRRQQADIRYFERRLVQYFRNAFQPAALQLVFADDRPELMISASASVFSKIPSA